MPTFHGHGRKVCPHGVILSSCRCINGASTIVRVECGMTDQEHARRGDVFHAEYRTVPSWGPPTFDALHAALRDALMDMTVLFLRRVESEPYADHEREVVDRALALLFKPDRAYLPKPEGDL